MLNSLPPSGVATIKSWRSPQCARSFSVLQKFGELTSADTAADDQGGMPVASSVVVGRSLLGNGTPDIRRSSSLLRCARSVSARAEHCPQTIAGGAPSFGTNSTDRTPGGAPHPTHTNAVLFISRVPVSNPLVAGWLKERPLPASLGRSAFWFTAPLGRPHRPIASGYSACRA